MLRSRILKQTVLTISISILFLTSLLLPFRPLLIGFRQLKNFELWRNPAAVARSIKNHIERRVTAAASAGSIKLPSPAPATVPVSANLSVAGSQRSRLSQQVSLRNSPARSARRATGLETNEDAEGEDDVEEDAMEEGGDTEDKELYCFCRKLSYGEVRTRLILQSLQMRWWTSKG